MMSTYENQNIIRTKNNIKIALIMVMFILFHIGSYKIYFGVGGIDMIIKKWKGEICSEWFCFKPAILDVKYGSWSHKLNGDKEWKTKTVLHLCKDHYESREESILESGYLIFWYLGFGGTVAGFFVILVNFIKYISYYISHKTKKTNSLIFNILIGNTLFFLSPAFGAYL